MSVRPQAGHDTNIVRARQLNFEAVVVKVKSSQLLRSSLQLCGCNILLLVCKFNLSSLPSTLGLPFAQNRVKDIRYELGFVYN
jgi:hypothetical protein